jgi:hypothetical protein
MEASLHLLHLMSKYDRQQQMLSPPELLLEPEELLALADEGDASSRLRTILLELESGVAGLKTVLPWLEEHWPTAIGHVATVFLVVSASDEFQRGPAVEKSLLIKACLEGDLKARPQGNNPVHE